MTSQPNLVKPSRLLALREAGDPRGRSSSLRSVSRIHRAIERELGATKWQAWYGCSRNTRIWFADSRRKFLKSRRSNWCLVAENNELSDKPVLRCEISSEDQGRRQVGLVVSDVKPGVDADIPVRVLSPVNFHGHAITEDLFDGGVANRIRPDELARDVVEPEVRSEHCHPGVDIVCVAGRNAVGNDLG